MKVIKLCQPPAVQVFHSEDLFYEDVVWQLYRRIELILFFLIFLELQLWFFKISGVNNLM